MESDDDRFDGQEKDEHVPYLRALPRVEPALVGAPVMYNNYAFRNTCTWICTCYVRSYIHIYTCTPMK